MTWTASRSFPAAGNGAHLLSETSHNATRQALAAEPGDLSMVS
jgi:hypothetical protein